MSLFKIRVILYDNELYADGGNGVALTEEGVDITGWDYQSSKFLQVDVSLHATTNDIHVVEIELPKELSTKIEGDKFFIKAYNINPRFRLKYLHEQVIIALTLLNQKEHFLYYVVPLMEEILEEIRGK